MDFGEWLTGFRTVHQAAKKGALGVGGLVALLVPTAFAVVLLELLGR